MADTKISDMPAATEVLNADELPIVQAGANKKATRLLLLTGAAGEDLVIQAGAGAQITLKDDAGTQLMAILSIGGIVVGFPGAFCSVVFNAAVPGDWNGAAPTKVDAALDRCATLLKALNGGVGP